MSEVSREAKEAANAIERALWLGSGEGEDCAKIIQTAINSVAALLRTKLDEAASLGWRVLRVIPQNLTTRDTLDLIKRTLSA